MNKREQFIQWLSDAHAMEVGIITTLEKHIADAKALSKVRAALANHLRETKRHATEMKKALSSLGGSHPVVKEGISKVANLAVGMVTSAAADTVVKNAIADFATEHFEIACYTSLISTAAVLKETKIAAVCRTILKEEKAMAATIEKQLREINDTYLASLDDERSEERPQKTTLSTRMPRGRRATSRAKDSARTA